MEEKGGTFTQSVTLYYINPLLSLSLEITQPYYNDLRKRNENTRNEEHSPTLLLKSAPTPKNEDCSRFGPLQVYLQAKEGSGRRDGATRRKSTRGSTGMPRKFKDCRVSAVIPGSYVSEFCQVVPLAARMFRVYPVSGTFARIFV